MKVITNNSNNPGNTSGKKGRFNPPIPLQRGEKPTLVKGEYLAYKLRNDPTNESSLTYELTVPFFSTGTCEEWLKFRANVERVLIGQHVTTGPAKFAVARRLLTGDALSVFNAALEESGLTETNTTYELCMDALARHVFPKRASQLQKRYMRRFIRKPADMSTRMFAARLQELNNYLPKFPTTAPGMPAPAKLEDDEIVDIMEFGVPRHWQQKMVEHDFDVMTSSIHEFIDFCDRMESITVEGQTGKNGGGHKIPESSQKLEISKNHKRNRATSGASKFCLVHGNTGKNGHTSNECKILIAQAKKARLTYEDGEGKRHRFPDDLKELNYVVDEHGTVRFGPKKSEMEALQARMNKIKKRKPSAQFEQELQNLEALELSDATTGAAESDASSSS